MGQWRSFANQVTTVVPGGIAAMRHAREVPRPLPKFSLLYVESLEDRLLLSELIPFPTSVLPEAGAVTIPALVQVDHYPRANQEPFSDPARSIQLTENGTSEPTRDQYFASGASGDSTVEPSTFSDDATPDDDYVSGREGAGAVDYPSEIGTEPTDAPTGDTASAYRAEQADGMAGSDEAYEEETTEEYEQYPPTARGFVQPVVTPAPATAREPLSRTSSAVDQVPPSSRPFQPSATTVAAKQASDPDPAARLTHESDSDGAEDLPAEPLAVPDQVAELESLTDDDFQELAEAPTSLVAEESLRPALEPGNLLAGASPIDLATLKRAAKEVLAQLEALGKELTAAPQGLSQSQWLVVAVLAAGTLELARRRIRRRSESTPPEGWDELSSHLFPVLAMPPKGEP
jgi:hypothetical protein